MDAGSRELEVGALYRLHAPMVFRRARAILGADSDAGDVVQEIFLGMLERDGGFEGRSSTTTWLYSVTTNLCLNRIRDGRNRARLVAEHIGPQQLATVDGSQPQTRSIVRQLLKRLSDDLRTVAVHYYVDEMTHEEIAEIMKCSRRHVGNLVARVEAHVQAEERV